ncbi:MAG: flagellar assembly protein FliW [Terriglobia bacterium]|nr:MAG: flagellar assembly protein FliW [Terriglobia bacterium]
MPCFHTQNFATISYETDSVLEFPRGLPGFEERRRFLALQFADSAPLVFLQSLEDSGLCFITMPVLVLDREYQLHVSAEDRAQVGLPPARGLRIGEDVACLAVISVRESGCTANLLAPVVVNLRNRRAIQSVAAESGYAHQHPLVPEEAPVCS